MTTMLASTGQRKLSVLFGSEARAAILTWFSLHPGEEVLLRDLCAQCGLSVTPVHRQLRKLEEIGIVQSRIVGTARAYKLRSDFPGLSSLGELVKRTAGIAAMLDDALGDLPIEVAFIFGSVANGTEGPGSDVDVFVVTDVPSLDISSRFFDVEGDLLREINSVTMTPDEFAERMASPSAFLMNVMRLEKIFIRGDEDVLRRLAAQTDT